MTGMDNDVNQALVAMLDNTQAKWDGMVRSCLSTAYQHSSAFWGVGGAVQTKHLKGVFDSYELLDVPVFLRRFLFPTD